MAQGEAYGHKADMWAVGCLVYEMIYLEPAFRGNSLSAVMRRIRVGRYERRELPAAFSLGTANLLDRLLVVEPGDRASADDVLCLPAVMAELWPQSLDVCAADDPVLHESAPLVQWRHQADEPALPSPPALPSSPMVPSPPSLSPRSHKRRRAVSTPVPNTILSDFAMKIIPAISRPEIAGAQSASSSPRAARKASLRHDRLPPLTLPAERAPPLGRAHEAPVRPARRVIKRSTLQQRSLVEFSRQRSDDVWDKPARPLRAAHSTESVNAPASLQRARFAVLPVIRSDPAASMAAHRSEP